MPIKLIADRGTDQIGAIGEEPITDEEVDPAEIDVPDVQRDFSDSDTLVGLASSAMTISLPSMWMAKQDVIDSVNSTVVRRLQLRLWDPSPVSEIKELTLKSWQRPASRSTQSCGLR